MTPRSHTDRPTRVLLQTTIPSTPDDWHIGRFSLLKAHLESLTSPQGRPMYEVVARDRSREAHDPVLSTLDTSDFDELWLFAVDTGDGLSDRDCAGINRFRARGGGLLTARDHQDLGCSVCKLDAVGAAHHFHTQNLEAPDRCVADDTSAPSISWPNYHSGDNGDVQRVIDVGQLHEVLTRADGSAIREFPAHPHEGAVGVGNNDPSARVIASGTSKLTKRSFNLIVALESGATGRALAHASFHHFVDYNWDTSTGCPTFVTDPVGHDLQRAPERLADVKTYVANAAKWLARR